MGLAAFFTNSEGGESITGRSAMTTGDSYTGHDPCRFEQYITKLSVRSCDPSSQGGGSSGPPRITQGEGAARMAGLHVPEVRGLMPDYMARESAAWLISYKYLGQKAGRSSVYAAGMMIATSLAMDNKWKLEPRGCLKRCVEVAIDDICSPAPFLLPVRAWSNLIGCENHMQWRRTWQARYREIRYYIEALEMAAIEHIRRAG